MKNIYLVLLFFFCLTNCKAQSPPPYWTVTSCPTYGNRYDDIWFINENVGWALNFGGHLHKTIDGGNTWQALTGPVGNYYRSITFMDSLNGFIGKLNSTPPDSNFLFNTNDGGLNWNPVSNLPPPQPFSYNSVGICGMYAVNDSVIYACGRYYGPAIIYKSIDKGNSWTYFNMSAYAYGLVDCYFWHPDSGIVVGIDTTYSHGVILMTNNGGADWQIVHTTSGTYEWCWKISFPSHNVGYVSIEQDNTLDHYFLKTYDGGITWQEMLYDTTGFHAQGIGFVNELEGWIGNFVNIPGFYAYHTIDGGLSWSVDTLSSINRFRFISDSAGFASGHFVFKYYRPSSTNTNEINSADVPVNIFPNPAQDEFTISGLQFPVQLKMYDVFGREVFQKQIPASDFRLLTSDFSNGVYIIKAYTGKGVFQQKLIIQR